MPEPTIKVFREVDANILHLSQQQVAVLGYGNLGRPVALNLRDSGVQVIIGNVEDRYADEARQDRFEVYPISQAVAQATIFFMAMPDEVMPDIYLRQIAPALKAGDMLLFASGYNIAYEYIEPPVFVDVGLVAPRTLAANIRQAYLTNKGYPTFIGLHYKATPTAQDRLLAVALGMGALKRGAIEVSFRHEVELDLFWQQAILPALHGLLLMASNLLIQEGYTPESALTELYLSGELGEFFFQASQQGLVPTLESMSLTGQYGVLSRTERFQESKLRAQMESILDAIRRGDFASEWGDEYVDGYPRLKRIRDKLEQTTLWKTEQKILQLYDRGS
jgi:ketol-acid reductoisomerase